MIYISSIIDKQVYDVWGNEVGRCIDIIASNTENSFPHVAAINVKNSSGDSVLVPSSQVSSLFPGITLKIPSEEISSYHPKGSELFLKQQVLDHQIVDVEGRRVVRVNDIQLAYSKEGYVVSGVDVGNLGLLRRLGLEKFAINLAAFLKRPFSKGVIAWNDVAYVEEKDPLRLNKSKEKISKLPPADIAMILSDLDRSTGQTLLEEMDNETLADALEESPTKTQIEVLTKMDAERAADVLEEMDPDEAADLLADMPEETSSELLDLMEEQEAEDIRALLEYAPDTAGGIMTTDFAWIYEGLTVSEAMDFLRSSEDAQEVDDMYYIYVLDKSDHLVGVIYLRDLVMALPEIKVDELMDDDPITVSPLTPQNEVAYLIAKYDLLSIPVVEESSETMLGIVTLDDALDTVLPTAYKKRLPRFF